jgi:hypothetical protein
MCRSRRFGCLLPTVFALLAGLVPAAGAAADPGDAAGGVCDPSLRLVWVDDGLAGDEIRDEAEREAGRIWTAAGITLRWGRSMPGRLVERDEILVIVRARLAGRPLLDARGRRSPALGRVVRVSEDQPSRLIELVMPDIVATVLGQSVFDRRVADLPDAGRTLALGRALGRVAAHEIGHWLFGREHAPRGLMRASITRQDLVDRVAPSLPSRWPSTAVAQLQARRPCPVARIAEGPASTN